MLRDRRTQVIAVEVALVASMVSIAVQTRFGDGPNSGSLPGNLVGIGIIGVPVLVLVGATRRWRIWPALCVLSVPWLLLGIFGDLSGTDAGFAMLVPAFLLLVQVGLVVLGLVVAAIRHRSSDGTERR